MTVRRVTRLWSLVFVFMMMSPHPKIRNVFWPLLQSALILFLATSCLLPAGCRQSGHSPASGPSLPAQAQNSPDAGLASKTAYIRTEIGFATRRKFFEHYDKHGSEFGSISKEEYLRRAQELRDRQAGGDILEVRRGDGVITRFDRKTGSFLAFNSDLTIRTFFVPNDGESYFQRQSRRASR